MQCWLRHQTPRLTRCSWVAGWPFASRWNAPLRLSEPHVSRLQHLERYAQFARQRFSESQFQMKCFLGTFAGAGPDDDADEQDGPEISWPDFIVNSLQCMRSVAMAPEAIEQWQQLQLRAFTLILVCVKGPFIYYWQSLQNSLLAVPRTIVQNYYHNNNPTVHFLKKWDNAPLRSGPDYQACGSSMCRV